MPAVDVKEGEHCLFRVVTDLVYRKSPSFDDELVRDPKTTVKQGAFIKGCIKRGTDNVVYAEVTVDAGERIVLCYLPMFCKEDHGDVYVKYLGPSETTPNPEEHPELVPMMERLVNGMGYTEFEAIGALGATDGDLDKAVAILAAANAEPQEGLQSSNADSKVDSSPGVRGAACASFAAKEGELCFLRVCIDLVYRRSPSFDDTLVRDPKTTVREGSFVNGRIKHGIDGALYAEVTVDAGERMVLCYLPVCNRDNHAEVYITEAKSATCADDECGKVPSAPPPDDDMDDECGKDPDMFRPSAPPPPYGST